MILANSSTCPTGIAIGVRGSENDVINTPGQSNPATPALPRHIAVKLKGYFFASFEFSALGCIFGAHHGEDMFPPKTNAALADAVRR